MAEMANVSVARVINCSIAQSIVPNTHYRIAVITESTCGAYAFLMNIFLLVVGRRVMVFPSNLRLLLGHLSFVLAWYGLGGLVKGVYLLTTPVCDLVITARNCRVLEMMTLNIGIVAMVYSITALCIERIYATVRYRRYERTGRRNIPYLAVCSLVVIWVLALSFSLNGLFTMDSAIYTPICDGQLFAPRSILAPYYISYLVLEALAVFATIFVYYYNRFMFTSMVINRARYDLSARFQVDQNFQVNKVMMPSMILHLLCFVPNYALLLLFFDFDIPTKATLLHISYLWKQVYAGVHPTLAFAVNGHLKQQLHRNFVSRVMAAIGLKLERKPKIADINVRSKEEGEAHFKHLEELWSGQKPTLAAPIMKSIRRVGYIVETSL